MLSEDLGETFFPKVPKALLVAFNVIEKHFCAFLLLILFYFQDITFALSKSVFCSRVS